MVQFIQSFRSFSLKVQALIALIAFAFYSFTSTILDASYTQSKFPVPYFEQQVSFDAQMMKEWYAYMIEQHTFNIYLRTQFIDFTFIFAVIFAGFTIWTLMANLHKEGSFFHKTGLKMAFALPLAGSFDILENLVSFLMIANPTSFSDSLIIPYSTFATIKFGFWTIALLWFLLSLIALPITKILFRNKTVITTLIVLGLAISAYSQHSTLEYSNKWTVVTGLTQPLLLDGVNIAVNYTTNRIVFEYSHGMNLNYKEQVLRPEYKENVISIKSPYSTGAGVGYRFFSNKIVGMDLRAEAKVHQYNVQLNETESIEYTNFDLGGGLYTQVRPFGKKENFLNGFVIEPSIRYWANVASDLAANFEYLTPNNELKIHEPYPLNLFANISIGYTF